MKKGRLQFFKFTYIIIWKEKWYFIIIQNLKIMRIDEINKKRKEKSSLMEKEFLKNIVPEFLYKMLVEQYGEELTCKIIEGYTQKRKVTLRVNTLKENKKNIEKILNSNDIFLKNINWYEDAFIIENVREDKIKSLDIFENGKIYLQSLSSMIPPVILNPKENENILDMAAAPGGKTTQMVALSKNKAMITACEKNKIRAEKLKYNLEKQGASRTNVMIEDARNLSDYFSFDKILLDAPCSGSGTVYIENGKFPFNLTVELINKSAKTQEQLLIKALKILKPKGEMIYSTCSILEKENEEILKKVLNKFNAEIIPIQEEWIKEIPTLPVKIEGTLCVCPNELYEGFFVAKIRKNK